MKGIWAQPELIVSIINCMKIDELKKYLATFFVNNLYENIVSKNYLENNIIYIFTLLLQSEINNLNDIDDYDKFLNNTKCGVLLEQLRKKIEIQIYFRKITENAIKNLENNYNSVIIDFNMKNLILDEKELKYIEIMMENLEINSNNNYLKCPDEKIMIDFEKEYRNGNIINFSKIFGCEFNPKIYFSTKFISFLDSNNSNSKFRDILNLYQCYFTIVVNFINEIIENILDNKNNIPNSIICLFKIIYELIQEKFPSLDNLTFTRYLFKFFFNIILFPYLLNPNGELFMNDILSKNTLENLKTICMIFSRYASASFFKSKADEKELMYTPFNVYFYQNMEKIDKIFEKLNNGKLPLFIENLIKQKLPKNYKYDYFEENNNRILNYNLICFNLEQFFVLLETMKKNIRKIFGNEKNPIIYDIKLNILMEENNTIFLNSLFNSNGVEEKKVEYFAIPNLIINKKFQYLFNIKKNNFISNISNEDNKKNNDIIKTKKMLYFLLNNINNLKEINFVGEILENSEIIFEKLNSILKLSNDKIQNCNSETDNIPLIWYLNSFLDCMNKIKNDSNENNYKIIYDHLESDINKSTENYNFKLLNDIAFKIKKAKKNIEYYQNISRKFEDMKLNEEVRRIVDNYEIIVNIYLKYEGTKNDVFKIQTKNDKALKDYKNHCKTIKDFIKKFPNLNIYTNNMETNVYKIQNELNFAEELIKYFQIVENSLKKQQISNLDLIMNKIKEYIMINIYKQINGEYSSSEDNAIFKNSFLLSWVELKHFLNHKNDFIIGNLENEIKEYIQQLTEENNIETKFKYLNKIIESIEFFKKINGINNSLIPILKYSFIKSIKQEMRVYSNFELMKIYFPLVQNKINKNIFEQFIEVCEIMPKIDYKNLINISKDAFDKKCNEIRNEK